MGVLTAKQRSHLESSQFGLPGTHQYPINDRSHAENAKARAAEEYHKGRLSKKQELTIDRRADAVLRGHKPG